MDTEDAGFLPLLRELRREVMEHARSEERNEFLQPRRRIDPGLLAAMAKGVTAAETVAPTHPHRAGSQRRRTSPSDRWRP